MYGKSTWDRTFAVPFEEKYENFYGDGPFDLENRYITEDVPVGCYLIQQLGRKYHVPTPTVDSMIYLAKCDDKERPDCGKQIYSGVSGHRSYG